MQAPITPKTLLSWIVSCAIVVTAIVGMGCDNRHVVGTIDAGQPGVGGQAGTAAGSPGSAGSASSVGSAGTVGSAGSVGSTGSAGSAAGGAAGGGAAGTSGGGGSTVAACSCAPGSGISVLACGPGFPTFQGRDAPEAMISARGDTVVFNRCVPAGGTCSTNSDVVRWTTATGSTRLGSAWAYAASADGATILADTGNGSTGSSHPVIWRDGSFADLNLAGAFARLLSADGAVVAARVETSVGVTQVVLRSVAGTTTMLGDLPGGPEYSEPNAINVDGTVVAGYGNTTGGQEPFVWTAAAGQMVNLGSITTVNQTVARAVSSDGTAAAGTSLTGSGTGIFHWTAAGGMKGIGYRFDNVPGPSPFFFLWSPPILISSDGTIVAGTDTNPTDPRLPRAFRWNSVAGSVALTPSTDASILRAASQDGRRLLGARVKSSAPPGMPAPLPGAQISFTPFVWDATGGTQDLAAVLGAAGIDLGGLTLGDPIAISADGTNVVGHAACGADTVIYRVTLPL